MCWKIFVTKRSLFDGIIKCQLLFSFYWAYCHRNKRVSYGQFRSIPCEQWTIYGGCSKGNCTKSLVSLYSIQFPLFTYVYGSENVFYNLRVSLLNYCALRAFPVTTVTRTRRRTSTKLLTLCCSSSLFIIYLIFFYSYHQHVLLSSSDIKPTFDVIQTRYGWIIKFWTAAVIT
jgi:hypothetical protein